jgi:hypothetical protein
VAARLRYLLPAVLAATAFSVPAANAGLIGNLLGGNCPTGGSQVFAPWQDYASYLPAPNGGLESGTTGWSLAGGATVVSGNEPFLRTGSHALSLPSGSSALSPVVCLGQNQLFLRMFGADSGGSDKGLRVQVVWYGLLNKVLGISDFATYGAGGAWSPTSKLSSGGGLQVPLLPILGSTSARVMVTPLGSGSAWQIDDLYIDPCIGRIG